jgi:DNA-binding SARP family transcriptional activator
VTDAIAASEDGRRVGPPSARAAKLAPPRDPNGTMARPALEQRIAESITRRLTVLVAGAGFGKSTLAARVAATRPSAWYTADAADRHLGTFASGVVAAIRQRVPAIPADLANPIELSVEPRDDTEAQSRGHGAATLIADALQEALTEDLVLVIDDVHALDGAAGPQRFLEALVRVAPPTLHLLLVSRSELPFGVERLRGQGEVADMGVTAFAFTAAEIETLLRTLLADAIAAGDVQSTATRIHAATGGWPAAVRLAIEALRTAPDGGHGAVLDRLQRPEGPLFSYLAEEVVSRASEAVHAVVARAVHFDRFSAPLLTAVGAPDAERVLDALARRALFLQPLQGAPGWWSLHGLIREFTLVRLALGDDEIAQLHAAAATWFEAAGRHDEALASLLKAGDPEPLAAFLDRHGPALVLSGASRLVADAAATLPEAMRTPRLERAVGEGYLSTGEWRHATAAFTRAAGGAERLDAASAWRLGLVHGLRGAYDDALAVYARADLQDAPPAEEGMLFAWIASARYHRGEVEESRVAAERALERATVAGDERALAAAYTAVGASSELASDYIGAAQAYDRALEHAERAGDALQEIRIRVARGVLELDRGRFEAAFGALDVAVRLAEAIGFAAFHARALVHRGRAHQGVGRFEEALADYAAAREIYDRIGSPAVAYALVREGSLHLLRGDPILARFAFEAGVRAARPSADTEALAPALVGLAEALASDGPFRARDLAQEAVELGRAVVPVTVLLGAARVQLALGERKTAGAFAREAADAALPRQDQPGLAAALEVEALTFDDPVLATEHVERAAELWATAPAPYGIARNRMAYARIVRGEKGRAAAVEAERLFRSLGARGPAADAASLVEELDRAGRPPVEIGSLGRFRVLRDGEPVAATAWQSKKARDLLKILVSRRGRPVPRETLFELLWPDEDPEPLANRLSVALATVRGVLDPDKRYAADWFIAGDKQALWLDLEHVEVDVERFLAAARAGLRLAKTGDRAGAARQLEAAEVAYGGDLLEEDPYEDWAVGLREEAQATYIAVTRTLADTAVEAGDVDAATRYFLRILERDAYDEAAHLGLVGALLTGGRHGEARRRYGLYATKMDEMGVEAAPLPSPATRDRPTGRMAAAPA